MKQKGNVASTPKQIEGEEKGSKQRVFNLIILDESGSMCIIRPIPVQFPEVLQGTGEA